MSESRKNFLLSMWLQNRLTEDQVGIAVARGQITQDEANEILLTPRSSE